MKNENIMININIHAQNMYLKICILLLSKLCFYQKFETTQRITLSSKGELFLMY